MAPRGKIRPYIYDVTSKSHACSCNMEQFLVCSPCYNEEAEGLGLYRRLATLRE